MTQVMRARDEESAVREREPWFSRLSPVGFLERTAMVYPDKPAVVYGDARYTYAELAERVRRLASGLLSAGLQYGDRIAFLCPNTPPMLEAHFAVPMAGGVLVPINIRLAAEEIAYILDHSGARLLFVDGELAPLVEPRRARLRRLERVVTIVDAGQTAPAGETYEQFLASGSPGVLSPRLDDENDLLGINYTSGTTGEPKGVMVTHRGGYLNAVSQALHIGLTSDSTYLWTLPMFHCNGWCFTWAVTAVGGTHVCLRRFDPEAVWGIIEQQEISHFCAAPTVLIALANHPAAKGVRLKRRLTIPTGGAPPSPTILDEMTRLGAEVIHLYGLTETYGPSTICEAQPSWSSMTAAELARFKARQGVPHVTAREVRVVDEAMVDVPADGETIGEVVMRGNTVMKGYFEQPEATAEAFRGGWFHSGDLAVMHPDGYIELRDRKKDVIISGGENISSIEVERVIAQHPAVLEVAVIAIPDERWGEVPKAFVTARPGQTPTAEEVIAFCREHLAHFKAPKQVEFGELPKTATGKVQKFTLREREWAGRGKRIN